MSLYERLKPRLPNLPGCYLMKDGGGAVIYVGKAKDLKKRVSSYFLGKDQSVKTQALVANVHDVDFIVTDTEVEALVLENNLIKRYQPKYNIELKTNVRYAYIALTDELFPRIMTVRKRSPKGSVWGPYTDGFLRVQLIKLAIDVYKLRICRTLPKKPCLQYHLGKCDAPCIDNISKDAYAKNVAKVRKLLDGKTDELERELTSHMKCYAKNHEFEKAREKRDQLVTLAQVVQRQKVETKRAFDQDVIATLRTDDKLKIIVFQIQKGVIGKREKYTIDVIGESPLSDFLRAYYGTRDIPKEVIIDHELDDNAALTTYFSDKAGKVVEILVPERGERKALLDMARQNAAVDFQEEHPALAELARVLKLRTLPRDIECFDISHLGAQDVVAASVHYRDGEPLPEEFRRYDIKTVAGQDDFRSIQEAVGRRYARLKAEGKQLPDLVVIDGGPQQLRFARQALKEAGISGAELPTIALAKREEEIYYSPNIAPLRLPRNNPALKLLQRIRDSTHRFVLGFQKVKRAKRMLE